MRADEIRKAKKQATAERKEREQAQDLENDKKAVCDYLTRHVEGNTAHKIHLECNLPKSRVKSAIEALRGVNLVSDCKVTAGNNIQYPGVRLIGGTPKEKGNS